MTFPIIKIIWKDARTDIGGGQTLRQIKNSKLSETHTMGYLVHEDKEKIAICSFYHPTYDEEEYQDGFKYVHLIPKKWIIKKIILKEIKNDNPKT